MFLSSSLNYLFNDSLDKFLDFVLAIKTFEMIPATDLRFENEIIRNHASPYQGVWTTNFFRLVRAAKNKSDSNCTFVDLGSGKGRVCFLASYFNFKEIIGVEYDNQLISISNLNKERVRFLDSSSISFICDDAGKFSLPEKQCLVFMFNPFDEFILQLFLKNNLNNFKKFNSKILYANDKNVSKLIEMGFSCLWKNPKYKLSIWELI